MEALIEDRKSDYDTDYTQDLYIANMNHYKLLMDEVHKDQTSTDTEQQKLYKEGSFIGMIARHADCVFGSRSMFHVSAPDTTISRPLPGGRIDRQNQQGQPRICRSFRSRSSSIPANTNSLSNDWESDWEDVNMTDADSIWNYCVNGLEYELPDDNVPSMIQFAHAIRAIAKDMNKFDKSKFLCAVCDQLGHTFEDCPVLQATDLKEAYLCLLLLIKKFVKGLN